jgi:hypothetical protein
MQAAEDYRFDYKLRNACSASVESVCSDVDPGEGRELDCLVRGRRGAGRGGWVGCEAAQHEAGARRGSQQEFGSGAQPWRGLPAVAQWRARSCGGVAAGR